MSFLSYQLRRFYPAKTSRHFFDITGLMAPAHQGHAKARAVSRREIFNSVLADDWSE